VSWEFWVVVLVGQAIFWLGVRTGIIIERGGKKK